MFKLAVQDSASMWLSSEADNIIDPSDLYTLAYYWDLHKFEKIGRIMRSGPDWVAAADLCLWCLQTKPERRPQTFLDIIGVPEDEVKSEDEEPKDEVNRKRAHRFFDADGELHYFESTEDTMTSFEQRQAKALAAAIGSSNKYKVQALFDHGGAHLKMIDDSIAGSTVSPLMRSAFAGDPAVVQILLGEIADTWPQDVKKEYLDQRTSLGLTAYMIACACGYNSIADMLAAKGCSTELKNSSGKTGADLQQAFKNEHDQSVLIPFNHGHKLHLGYDSLEAYLISLGQMLDEDVAAGIRLWNSKQLVYHLDDTQMEQLEATVAKLLPKSCEIALHFTDFACSKLILNPPATSPGKGIRLSAEGQLGGGVSVCLRSLSDFGWGGGWVEFCLGVGKALWGSKWVSLISCSRWQVSFIVE